MKLASTLLVLAGISGLTAPVARSEELVTFPGVELQGGVAASFQSAGSCSTPLASEPFLCQSAPYKKFCRDPRALAMIPKAEANARQAEALVNPEQGPALLKKTKPLVLKTVQNAVRVFLRMLGLKADGTWSDHRILSLAERESLRKILSGCAEHLSLAVKKGESLEGSNAYNSTQFGKDTTLAGEYRRKSGFSGQNEVSLSLLPTNHCSIELTGEKWLECADSQATCMQALFHELGHSLNSCVFYKMSQISGNLGQENPTSSLGVALSLSSARQLGLAQELDATTSCLTELSAPKFPLLNDCNTPANPASVPASANLEKKCSPHALKDYPSQWNEAEADFWGASAMAEWLGELRSTEQRREKIFETAPFFCGIERVPYPKQSLIPASCGARSAETHLPPVAKAWDEHPSLVRRFEGNYLRNLDLRNALGCRTGPDTGVASACSPAGKRVWAIP